MVKEIGMKKKYFLLLTMLTLTCCIVIYIVKKIFARRAEYLKELSQNQEVAHGESAILEEQSAILEEQEDKEKDHMKVDLTQYFEYQNYEPEGLWEDFEDKMKKKHAKFVTLKHNPDETDDEPSPARVEILFYYQSFVKLFRIHLQSLQNLNCFKTNDVRNVKVKIVLRRTNENCFEDVSGVYEFEDDIITFDDKFSFDVKLKELSQYTIYISVWSMNVFHHEILLGAAHIDLSSFSEYTTKQVAVSDIVPVKKDLTIYGYLLVGLCYLPDVERLICVVMTGKNFKDDVSNMSILNNVINPFVDVFLINDGKIIKRHSTQIILDKTNPVFNEAFEFYIPSHQVPTSDIYLVAMHKYNRITNTLIGKVMVGNHSDGEQNDHWKNALSKPETLVLKWYQLTR